MAKHLEDIGKDAKDLLTEGYPIDGTVKFTAQTSTFGFTHKSTLSRSIKRDKSGVREIVNAAFEPKFEFKEHKVEITGKLNSANEASVGASVRDIGTNGTKIEVNLTGSQRDGMGAVLSTSYKNNALAAKGKLTYPLNNPRKSIKINTEGVVHHTRSNSNVGVGVDVVLEGEVARIFTEGVVSHSAKDSQFKGLVRYDVYESYLIWGLSFFQKVNERNNWAFDITSENYNAKNTFSAGTEYKVDSDTTFKGKWRLIKQSDRVDYRLGASLKQKLSAHVVTTFGSDLNLRSFLGSSEGEPNSFGLEIKYQD